MSTIPFKADHVGSLLRPTELLQAREDFKKQLISRDELARLENRLIQDIVKKQVDTGLNSITDGEFRRAWWHFDFLEGLNGVTGYIPDEGLQFSGVQTKAYDVKVTEQVTANLNHTHFEHADFLLQAVGRQGTAKVTIPSPNQLFHPNILNHDIYPDINDYQRDVSKAYNASLTALYDLGIRYVQLDDVYWAGLAATEHRIKRRLRSQAEKQAAIKLAVKTVNDAIAGLPDDLHITTHICRGNFRSSWAMKGGYGPIAEDLFKENLTGFFLEYDDERSGDFEPLQHFKRDDSKVVLGLFTSKHGALENKETIIERVEEASRYVPKEQLALSPQCGFSSTEEGNLLTEDDQWRKLKYVVDIAEEIL
ncbi:5-methyltetrahydropteroyltriglutamate--homocysteine S-methyltransferase [Macrococcus equipercicus]|uniref:5-methyltetrahydropteroyltriglutamate--homocysteine S-methyltransferase n=1 Tax=Macrococcus equipercicus TaxID=69967 RepID=A0ABQ6RB17_9STAP|nr:5-methyltetrahydropteroyltriglutamate--homocysteine S-methyltransferase [Macrococcus equipercicus]KAA1042368.1 5-methyltetrahydropteroyltriglutamate--homocysteine S-methyltransferase [Macrococcus equipercicus]